MVGVVVVLVVVLIVATGIVVQRYRHRHARDPPPIQATNPFFFDVDVRSTNAASTVGNPVYEEIGPPEHYGNPAHTLADIGAQTNYEEPVSLNSDYIQTVGLDEERYVSNSGHFSDSENSGYKPFPTIERNQPYTHPRDLRPDQDEETPA